jgi:hypothetical protein
MSAVRALPLPEHDAESRPAAICLVPRQAVRAQPAGAHPEGAQAAGAQPARRPPARPPTVAASPHGQAARPRAAAAPLRLTNRGRIVVAAFAALLITLLSLLATGAAQATSHSVPPRLADRNLTQVVVQPGQSLWSVAENADPNADPRQVMQQIIELNGLTGDVIMTGQRLWVPRG